MKNVYEGCKRYLYVVLLTNVISSIAAFPVAYYLRYLIDAVGGKEYGNVVRFLVFLTLYSVVVFVFEFLRTRLVLCAKTFSEDFLLEKYIATIAAIGYVERSELGTNEIIRRMQSVKRVVAVVYEEFSNFIACVFVIGVLLVYFWGESLSLFISSVLMFAVYVLLYIYTMRRNRFEWNKIAEEQRRVRSLNFAFVGYMTGIRVCGGSGFWQRSMSFNNSGLFRLGNENVAYNKAYSSLCNVLAELYRYTVLALSVVLIEKGVVTVGGAISNFVLVGYFVYPVTVLINSAAALSEIVVHIRKIEEVESHLCVYDEDKRFSFRDSIEFNNVDFGYTKERSLLKKFSCTIKSGCFNIIVGRNGIGKTSIIRILLGELVGFDGCVKVDGVPIREIDKEKLRGNVAYVSQGVGVFPGTVKENVALGRPIDDLVISDSMREVGLLAFFEDTYDGINTEIGEGGVGLSVGMERKINLARVLCESRDFLVFDEIEANLDARGKEVIRNFFAKCIREGKTILVVTHELAGYVDDFGEFINLIDLGS